MKPKQLNRRTEEISEKTDKELKIVRSSRTCPTLAECSSILILFCSSNYFNAHHTLRITGMETPQGFNSAYYNFFKRKKKQYFHWFRVGEYMDRGPGINQDLARLSTKPIRNPRPACISNPNKATRKRRRQGGWSSLQFWHSQYLAIKGLVFLHGIKNVSRYWCLLHTTSCNVADARNKVSFNENAIPPPHPEWA